MVFTLLIIYQIKHLLADYPLQTPYMLGKFKGYPDYIRPLLAHVAVHGAFTLAIALIWVPLPLAFALALLDSGIHFLVDRIKASPNMLGRYESVSKREMIQIAEDMKFYEENPYSNVTKQAKPQTEARLRSNRLFWYALGADQMAHHLTHYLIIYIIWSSV